MKSPLPLLSLVTLSIIAGGTFCAAAPAATPAHTGATASAGSPAAATVATSQAQATATWEKDKIETALNGPGGSDRLSALTQLFQYSDLGEDVAAYTQSPAYNAALKQIALNGDEAERILAIYLLARTTDKEALQQALLSALSGGSELQRVALVTLKSTRLHSAQIEEKVLGLLGQDTPRGVYESAASYAIAEFPQKALTLLIGHLTNPDNGIRRMSVQALGQFKTLPPSAADKITEALELERAVQKEERELYPFLPTPRPQNFGMETLQTIRRLEDLRAKLGADVSGGPAATH